MHTLRMYQLRQYLRNRLTLAVLFLCIGAGIVYSISNFERLFLGGDEIDCDTDYKFINPEPDCELYEEKVDTLRNLELKLLQTVATLRQEEVMPVKMSVWVRDLQTRRFVGIEENDLYLIPQFLKLPTAVAAYKYVEFDQNFLSRNITYTEEGVKRTDTVEILIEKMLIESSDTATQVITQNLPSAFKENVFKTLGLLVNTPSGDTRFFVTARSYANIFRTLYNGSYLSRDASERVLALLQRKDAHEGMAALIKEGTAVAEKYSERILQTSQSIDLHQISDCGIVYLQNDEPFIFCIMTEGADLSTLRKTNEVLLKIVAGEFGYY